MAYTRIQELTGFNTGPGGSVGSNPVFWPEDVELLLSQTDTTQLLQVNIVFQGRNLNGMVGKPNASADPNAMVLIQCPPYQTPLVEVFA